MCSNNLPSELKTILSQNIRPFNEENHDPNPNIINATELNMDLLPSSKPTTTRNKRLPSNKATVHRTNMDHPIESVAKPYDRIKAKEYIAAQQKKRLLEKKTANDNASNEQKDEIKKRLAELHKNSLKILKKNVTKKHKEIGVVANSTVNVDEEIAKNPVVTEPTTNVAGKDRTTVKPIGESVIGESVSKEVDKKSRPTTKSLELHMNLTPRKRGILRQNEPFEGPPSSTSQPQLDKTTVDALLQTVRQRKSISKESSKFESQVNNHTPPPAIDKEMKLNIPQSELKSTLLSRNSSRSRSKSWDVTRSSASSNKRPSTSIRARGESKMNIPYWLKPSSTHAYPYNFIMAVRKKLESVTQPILVEPLTVATDTPLARPQINRQTNSWNFRNNLDKPDESYVAHETSKAFMSIIDSIPSINHVKESPAEIMSIEKSKSNQISIEPKQSQSASEEFSTNFSSISLHITDRNTMSELSSIHSEQQNQSFSPSKKPQQIDVLSDDTTISSAILSRASPEKKSKRRALFVEPLSTEGIEDLKIQSLHSNASSLLHPFVNTQRGNVTEQSQSQLLPNDLDNRNMLEMFETFSKNLSQVISVNEKLHSALSRQSNLSVREISNREKTQRNSNETLVSESQNLDLSSNTVGNEKSDSKAGKTVTEQAYTSSFEVSNDNNIPEEVVSNSEAKTETNPQQSNNKSSVVEPTTETVSEHQSSSVLVTTTIDTQTFTSRKTEIIAANGNESARSIDPEFRRFSDASSIIGSDIFAVFSQSDEENQAAVVSEESFNYSRIGMFDQLINNEKQKSEHLSKLMKIREKSLIDRTKGQIAWLELQKQKYKEQGLTDRISAVKKKQRALLMHMAAERANILRLSKLQQSPKSQSSSKFKFQNFSAADFNVKRPCVGNELYGISQRSAVRAYEIDATSGLEGILRKREEELQKRRNHVEHLIQWHQRLNREENDLMEMERMLMTYTGAFVIDNPNSSNELPDKSRSRSPRKQAREVKKIENIEKSLQLLHDMSSKSVTTNGEEIEDVVEASGKRLNKLWRRLTGEDSDKFIDGKHYKLNKFDLEKMYEDAKNVVISKFNKNKDIGSLIDQSQSQSVLQESTDQDTSRPDVQSRLTDEESQHSIVPLLNLNFSSESTTDSVKIPDTNEENKKPSDSFYFENAESENTSEKDVPQTVTVVGDTKTSTESDQDNTQADTISLDKNTSSSSSQNSFNETEIIDEISFPNLQDVTSINNSIPNDTDDHQTTNNSISTLAPTTSPSDYIITDNVVTMAQEFEDNELSDEFEKDNATDKSLQLQQLSSDESTCITKSNQTMLSNSELSEEISGEGSDNFHQSNTSSEEVKSIGLEQRLMDLDGSLKELSETIARAPVRARSLNDEKNELTEVKMVRNKIINETFPTNDMIISAGKHEEIFHANGKSASLIRDYVSPAGELKMPDIISEAEVLRRHQLQNEQEVNHPDSVVFLREIPNKPPPPYVPPAHGSPMTTIPPTDERIKEIVYRRISELYNAHVSDTTLVTEKSHSILAENITNVYERIILDVCKECIAELDIDTSTNCMKFKQPLAFYNPPNRLEYVQTFALNKVKKLLDPNTCSTSGTCVKRKRDLVDEMLVTEMIDDESKWSNFDLEEKEVIENIVEQIVLIMVNQAIDDTVDWQRSKTSVKKDGGNF